MANPEETTEKPMSKKIFLNNIDCFQGRNIGRERDCYSASRSWLVWLYATNEHEALFGMCAADRVYEMAGEIVIWCVYELTEFLASCVVGATIDTPEDKERASLIASTEVKKAKDAFYEIVGTAKDKEKPKPDFAKEIVQYENQMQLYEYLVECDIIIYDITDDPDQIQEAVWIITEMYTDLDKIEKPKVFILISTCMTWARTPSLEPESTEDLFTEDDYRKRKPHPNFKEHINAEKTVLKLGKMNKAKLSTFVICSGLTYGAEENMLHFLFKAAWHNATYLQCFGDGQNIIPTIHIRDLAAILQNVADGWSKFHYIIAKDNSQNTLEDIVRAISDNLGSKKVRYISKEEAFLYNEIEQSTFDTLLLNLKMDSVAIKDEMQINWVSEAGIAENIKQLVDEYKKSRNLQPIRAVILGPPASGKSTVAKQLCDYYKLHHILIKDVIDGEIDKLSCRSDEEVQQVVQEWLYAQPSTGGLALSTVKAKTQTPLDMVRYSDEYEASTEQQIQEAIEFLSEIEQSKQRNNGRVEDKYVIDFLRNRLMSMPCQNQGFVLDGYPKTLAQAHELYKTLTPDEPAEDVLDIYNKIILPEFVINLEATDNFLRRKVMSLPEAVVINTHNTEVGLLRRLKEYWAVNTYDETVLNFFDELELHSEKIDVTKDKSHMLKDTVEKIKKIIGSPRNYGATLQELEAIKRAEEEGRLKKERREKKHMERHEVEEMQDKKRRLEEWSQRLLEVKKQEFELLEVQSVPLRNYLMTYVMPTLTQALIDCCKVRPDDPIDFLAEYLFQHNPQMD